jgi:hypothetical protein
LEAAIIIKGPPCRQDPFLATSKVFESPLVLELKYHASKRCRRLVSEDGESRCSVFRGPCMKVTRKTRQRICHGGGRGSKPCAFLMDCWTERRTRKRYSL